MLAHQFFHSPSLWQSTGIGDKQSVMIDTDLNGASIGEVLMHQGIMEQFTNCVFRIRVVVHARYALIGDGGNEILEP